MQPLATSQLMLEWISSCPVDKLKTTPSQRIGQIVHTLLIVVINVNCSIASVAYCIKFASTDFNGSLNAFMIAIGQFGWIHFMFAAFRMRDQIGDIFSSLSIIYKKCVLNIQYQ